MNLELQGDPKVLVLSEKLFVLPYSKFQNAQTLVSYSLQHGEYYPKISALYPDK